MTRRERLERKAERLSEWADKREAKAEAAFETAQSIGDQIPFGQPILVGHHSEKRHRRDIGRIDSAMRASVEHSDKARDMARRAEGIRNGLANSIYSDDPDAIERLREKLADLEAKRERMKAANAEYRKAHKADLAEMTPYARNQAVPFPSYSISNIGGVITSTRKRLAQMERERGATAAGVRAGGRYMQARYGGECAECGSAVDRGDWMTYYRTTREVVCASCSGVGS